MIRDKLSGMTIETVGIMKGRRLVGGKIRDAISIRIKDRKHYELDELFTNGANYEEVMTDGEGNLVSGEDFGGFFIAGDIIDHRDGSFTVVLGMPTDEEKAISEAEEKAVALTVGMDEESAERAYELLMEWKPAMRYPKGAWIKQNGKVYRCESAHVSRRAEVPGVSNTYRMSSREAKEGGRS